MIKWEKADVHDDGQVWCDHKSRDSHWWIAEGYNELARKIEKKPYTLLYRANVSKERWSSVDTFKTVAAAKEAAEELQNET